MANPSDYLPPAGQGWEPFCSQVLAMADPKTAATAQVEAVSVRFVSVAGFDLLGSIGDYWDQTRQQYQQHGSELFKVTIWRNPPSFAGTGYDDYWIVFIHHQASIMIAAVIRLLTLYAIASWVLQHLPQIEGSLAQLGQVFGKDWIAPAISPLVDASLLMFFATGLGLLGFWAVEHHIGERSGQEVPLPTISGIQAPKPLEVGVGSSYGFNVGPLAAGVSQQVGGTPPPTITPQAPNYGAALGATGSRGGPPRVPRERPRRIPAPSRGRGGGRGGGRGFRTRP